jgi:hypothetical protein
MKAKTFIILLVVFCLLAGAAYVRLSERGQKGKNRNIGEAPYAFLPMESIDRIHIKSDEADIHLKKAKSLWVVKDKFDFPADFPAISQLVSNLKTMKIGRRFQVSDDARTRLGLHLPDEKDVDEKDKGIRVIMKNAGEEILLDAVIGKTREVTAGAGGHYIMAMPGQTVYLVDIKFEDVGKTISDWIEKDILDIQSEDIQSITCYPLGGENSLYTLTRTEKGKAPELVDAPGSKLDPSKIDDVLTALAPLTIDDVAGYVGDPIDSETTYTHAFEYKVFDGATYRFLPGSTGDGDNRKFVVKITMKSGIQTIDPEGARTPPPILHQVIHQWLYEIPEWKFKRFILDRDTLLQKE